MTQLRISAGITLLLVTLVQPAFAQKTKDKSEFVPEYSSSDMCGIIGQALYCRLDLGNSEDIAYQKLKAENHLTTPRVTIGFQVEWASCKRLAEIASTIDVSDCNVVKKKLKQVLKTKFKTDAE
jgi:hypothetical protein